jgi:hypothetical protein
MRIATLGAAALLASCTAPPPTSVPTSRPISEIAGRTPGPAQRCVQLVPNESLRIVSPNALLYGAGRTVWLNRPPGDCRGLRESDVLVTEPINGQHCSGDLVRSFDRYSRIPGPSCRLGEFVPYTRG